MQASRRPLRRTTRSRSEKKIGLSRQEIIGAVKSMNKRDRDDFLEELLATTSPEYLESIKDARADYKAGRVKTHDEVFGH